MYPKTAVVRIGTSGYQYKHWRSVFYPNDIPQKRWFEYYAAHFDTVEINNTFYHLPEAHTFEDWRQRSPDGFLYALKFSRYATHLKHLKDPAQPIDTFLERANRLRDHLGPILVQLPPQWNVDVDRLECFLQAVSADNRWAIEFRNPGWLCENVYDVLRKHQVALVIHDLLPDHPVILTTDWVYLRYHGAAGEAGKYSRDYLHRQAEAIRAFQQSGHTVYAYFNNDIGGFAVSNALDLK